MNPSTAQAQVIVDELARCGVTDAVLCPGSRNAPLSFALHAADAAGLLRLHVRIDERTGAFLALGLATRSGRPVPVCTTSGTAVANLHPAVLEAAHAQVPLLALTADRPPELIGTGANQTVQQPGIFGAAIRGFATGVPADIVAGNGLLRSLVCRVIAAAVGTPGASPPGPVHLNLPLAEPLVPDGDGAPPAGRLGGAPWTAPAPPPSQRAGTSSPVGRSAESKNRGPRPGVSVPRGRSGGPLLPLDPAAPTLVIAGDGADPDLAGSGAPIVAEPSSPLWPVAVRTGPWLLGRPELRPAQVVVTGRPTLHRRVQRLLADPDIAVFAATDPRGAGWTDVAGTVRAVGDVPDLTPDPGWLAAWRVADTAACVALDAVLDDPVAPTGMRLARAVTAALPDGALFVLGSSNPIRDVALAAAPRPGLTILANRGVAGIDGTVSSAVGAALAHGGPGWALLGDLTLLHDTTGLVIGPEEPRPDLTLVVLNDDGGGIFGLLEQGGPAHSASFERVFGTPHAVDLAALCAATGVRYSRAEPGDPLPDPAGLALVEVRADRSTLRDGHARVRAAVAGPGTRR